MENFLSKYGATDKIAIKLPINLLNNYTYNKWIQKNIHYIDLFSENESFENLGKSKAQIICNIDQLLNHAEVSKLHKTLKELNRIQIIPTFVINNHHHAIIQDNQKLLNILELYINEHGSQLLNGLSIEYRNTIS